MNVQRLWIWLAYFLLAAAPGCWYPVFSNVLTEAGKADQIIPAFALLGAVSLLSPLLVGALADQRFAADKMLAVIIAGGAPILWFSFHAIEAGWGIGWVFSLMLLNAVLTGPAWHLLNTVALTYLPDAQRQFGFVRVGATLGWMAASVMVSQLGIDASPETGKIAAYIRILGGAVCLMLPHTRPQAERARSLGERLGLGAVKILRQRSVAVYLVTGFLFSIPMASLYIHTPLFLRSLGVEEVGQTMAVGQASEFIAMLMMGLILASMRLKWVFLAALACGAGRCLGCYLGAEFASSGWTIAGVALHGICWTLYFEAGRVFIHQRAGAEMRAQAQALLGIIMGVGNVLGILAIGYVYQRTVGEAGNAGWSGYWVTLTVAGALCVVTMALGYRGGAGKAEGMDAQS